MIWDSVCLWQGVGRTPCQPIRQRRRLAIKITISIPVFIERLLIFALLFYRRLRYGYPFRRIHLTQGKYAIVDPEDYHRLSKHKWHLVRSPRSDYAARCITIGKGRQKHIAMHRVIMNAWDGQFIDHINHNGLDNRKANLRLASMAQNSWNKRKQRGKHSSKYKGVSWFARAKKWQARIQANGTKIFLGNFTKEIDAAKAYDRAAIKYHRDFAYLNLPP
ncbi:MAG: endonuclease [Planctomycetes bacterium]|nr:endonuclease [Planctomycetota bacterium]